MTRTHADEWTPATRDQAAEGRHHDLHRDVAAGAEHSAVNLGQGFPDFAVPARLVDELDKAMRAGHNQYAPMTGIPALREAIAAKTERCYGWRPDADTRNHGHLGRIRGDLRCDRTPSCARATR